MFALSLHKTTNLGLHTDLKDNLELFYNLHPPRKSLTTGARSETKQKERLVNVLRRRSEGRGKVKGAERRSSSELSVCLRSRAAAASTSVAPSGSPHPRHPPLPFPALFIYLGFASTTGEPAGAHNKHWGRTRWWGGKQRVSFWLVSAAHMLSKESWHQSAAGNCRWGGDRGVAVL